MEFSRSSPETVMSRLVEHSLLSLNSMFFLSLIRIYIVHDEVKDKAFELELSWVGEGKNQSDSSGSGDI